MLNTSQGIDLIVLMKIFRKWSCCGPLMNLTGWHGGDALGHIVYLGLTKMCGEKFCPSLYDFKGHNIRVVEIDNSPWLVAADVCKALGLSHITNALTNCSANTVSDAVVREGKTRPNKIITEAGLYKLVMQSRKQEAKAFQDWVTGTVLPAIRKDGGYIKGGVGLEVCGDLGSSVHANEKWLGEMTKIKEALKIAFFIALLLAVPVWAVLFSDGSGPAENYYRGAEF